MWRRCPWRSGPAPGPANRPIRHQNTALAAIELATKRADQFGRNQALAMRRDGCADDMRRGDQQRREDQRPRPRLGGEEIDARPPSRRWCPPTRPGGRRGRRPACPAVPAAGPAAVASVTARKPQRPQTSPLRRVIGSPVSSDSAARIAAKPAPVMAAVTVVASVRCQPFSGAQPASPSPWSWWCRFGLRLAGGRGAGLGRGGGIMGMGGGRRPVQRLRLQESGASAAHAGWRP